MKGNVAAAAYDDILTAYAVFSPDLKNNCKFSNMAKRKCELGTSWFGAYKLRYATLSSTKNSWLNRGEEEGVSNTEFHHKLWRVSYLQQEQR